MDVGAQRQSYSVFFGKGASMTTGNNYVLSIAYLAGTHDAQEELERLRAERRTDEILLEAAQASAARAWKKCESLKAELDESARLHGKGASREAALLGKLDRVARELAYIESISNGQVQRVAHQALENLADQSASIGDQA